ncbi:MAG: hypothetical protein ACRDYA_10290 [Egibacteraceae bacterium]
MGISTRVLDYERSIAKAQDLTGYLASLRGLAIAYFAQGHLERGRAAFTRATAGNTGRFPHVADASARSEDASTQLRWAAAELGARQCGPAAQRYAQVNEQRQAIAATDGWDISLVTPELNALQESLRRRC